MYPQTGMFPRVLSRGFSGLFSFPESAAGFPATLLPATRISPFSGTRRRLISLKIVLLPQPEAPMMEMNSPLSTWKLR